MSIDSVQPISNTRESEIRKGGSQLYSLLSVCAPPQISYEKLVLIDNILNEVKFPKLSLFCP